MRFMAQNKFIARLIARVMLGRSLRSVTFHVDDGTLQRLVLGIERFMEMKFSNFQPLLMGYGLLL